MARDLHDGVQQRLFSLLVGLQLTREDTSVQLATLVDDAIDQAQAAIDDLHDLVAGLHPAVLTTRGLVAAVESLARRAPLPVMVTAEVPTRLASTIEVNAYYFFISEAITDVVKHAGASHHRGHARRFVDPDIAGCRRRRRWRALGSAGNGLISLSDRVTALDGEFQVDSPPTKGTVVHGTIPLS